MQTSLGGLGFSSGSADSAHHAILKPDYRTAQTCEIRRRDPGDETCDFGVKVGGVCVDGWMDVAFAARELLVGEEKCQFPRCFNFTADLDPLDFFRARDPNKCSAGSHPRVNAHTCPVRLINLLHFFLPFFVRDV